MRVFVVAPAGPARPDLVTAATEYLTQCGFDVEYDLARIASTDGMFSAPDEDRACHLTDGLTREGIDVVWFARGGYGTQRLLRHVDWGSIVPGRIVVGYSDASALHVASRGRAAIRFVHGPNLEDYSDPRTCLSPQEVVAATTKPRRLLVKGLCEGLATGLVVGGNLAVLTSLCGTPYQLNTEGCILLIEDVHETPRRIDRMLWQLQESGCLNGAVGFLVGSLAEDALRGTWVDSPSARLHLVERLRDVGIPTAQGPFGHVRRQQPLLLESPAILSVQGDHAYLELLTQEYPMTAAC